MPRLADVAVTASCGHRAWVPVHDCSYRHNADRMRAAAGKPCRDCSRPETAAARAAKVAGRIAALRKSAEAAPPLRSLPRGDVAIVPTASGWLCTLATGTTGESVSPVGAVYAALAAHLERLSGFAGDGREER